MIIFLLFIIHSIHIIIAVLYFCKKKYKKNFYSIDDYVRADIIAEKFL